MDFAVWSAGWPCGAGQQDRRLAGCLWLPGCGWRLWLWLTPVAAWLCQAGLAWPGQLAGWLWLAWPGLAWDSQPQPARQLKSRGSRIQAWRDSCNGNAFFLKSFLGILKKLFTKKAFPLRLCPQALMHGPLDFSCVAGCSVLPGAGQGWLRLSG